MTHVSIIQIVHPGTNKDYFKQSMQSVLAQDGVSFEYLIVGEANEFELLSIPTTNTIRSIRVPLNSTENTNKEFQGSSVSRTAKKNYGALHAQGKYLYFIDDDFVLDLGLLKEAFLKAETGFNMIAVHNTSDARLGIWARVRKFERDMYKYDEHNISARFVLKKLFDIVSGFNTNMVAAEDYDIHNRMLHQGGNLGFIDKEEIHLGEPTSLKDIISKHYYYGITLSKAKGNLTASNAAIVRPAYFKNWKKVITHPLLTLLFIFYQTVRFTAGGLGFIKGKLSK